MIGFVMDAMRKIVSTLIGFVASSSMLPKVSK